MFPTAAMAINGRRWQKGQVALPFCRYFVQHYTVLPQPAVTLLVFLATAAGAWVIATHLWQGVDYRVRAFVFSNSRCQQFLRSGVRIEVRMLVMHIFHV